MAIIPTTLLPSLPRRQDTLAPLSADRLIECMGVLKELYMPPIHGGFTAGDVELESNDLDAEVDPTGTIPVTGSYTGGGGLRKQRTMSGGSVDLVPGLGLEMEGLSVQSAIQEEDEDTFDDSDDEHDDDDDDADEVHNDPFEREWAEKWLGGVVRRAQTWIEEHEDDDTAMAAETETVLREATAVLAMMAGTSAAGSLTRHLLFPVNPELAPALRSLRPALAATAQANGLSPETTKFITSLATSPVSPMVSMRPLRKRGDSVSSSGSGAGGSRKRVRAAAVPVLLHDAPMADHLSVGVQTWGSAILLGREMALRPADFGLFQPEQHLTHGGYTRVLELGAGTGLLSILCRKLLDLRAACQAAASGAAHAGQGLVVATDFLPDVIANLRVCVDLNAPPRLPGRPTAPGIDIAKLDWTTFPEYMEAKAGLREADPAAEEEELAPWVHTPFDLVLASDCVYDPTHAALLRKVAAWVLRPPSGNVPSGIMVSKGRRSRLLAFLSELRTDSFRSTSSRPSARPSRPSSRASTWPFRRSRPTRRWRTAPLLLPRVERCRGSSAARGWVRPVACAWVSRAGSAACVDAVGRDAAMSGRGTGGGRWHGDELVVECRCMRVWVSL